MTPRRINRESKAVSQQLPLCPLGFLGVKLLTIRRHDLQGRLPYRQAEEHLHRLVASISGVDISRRAAAKRAANAVIAWSGGIWLVESLVVFAVT
jgi:hypothetical protein